MNSPPSPENRFCLSHCRLLASSYLAVTGRQLINLAIDDPDLGQKLYQSPVVVLSHGTEADPLFKYESNFHGFIVTLSAASVS